MLCESSLRRTATPNPRRNLQKQSRRATRLTRQPHYANHITLADTTAGQHSRLANRSRAWIAKAYARISEAGETRRHDRAHGNGTSTANQEGGKVGRDTGGGFRAAGGAEGGGVKAIHSPLCPIMHEGPKEMHEGSDCCKDPAKAKHYDTPGS
jgi:hypothetical protein